MSGLKINYHKSEVFVFGVTKEDSDKVANIFNCKLASLPMTYLGIMTGDRSIGVKAANKVINKLTKKLDNWKSNFLSSEGGGQINFG